jgi:pilus assembly protein CpaE
MAVVQDDARGATAGGPATSRYDVAVVEPDPRYRMRLGTQLAGAAQFESIEELVQHLRPGRPVVAVFGPSVAVPIGFEQVQRLVVAYPELGAVFAVGELSAPVLQAALRAGARDTVAAHDAASMVQSVARVGDLLHDSTVSRVPAVVESRANPGRLVVVFSTKGGVGKSTIAINVAVAMARRTDERVALVDADLHFGDIAVLLGIPPQTTITDAAASIQFADPGMLSTMLTRHESGVYVLPAPAEAVLGTTLPPEELVGVCSALQAFCGQVVVDTPTVFDDSILALLESSDEILLVGGMDIPSVKNLKIGMQALDLAAIAGPKLRLVLNRANTQVKLDVREIEQVLGLRAEFPIPSDIAVPISVNAGEPVVDRDPKSPASRAMEHIAVTLLGADAAVGSTKRRGRKQK